MSDTKIKYMRIVDDDNKVVGYRSNNGFSIMQDHTKRYIDGKVFFVSWEVRDDSNNECIAYTDTIENAKAIVEERTKTFKALAIDTVNQLYKNLETVKQITSSSDTSLEEIRAELNSIVQNAEELCTSVSKIHHINLLNEAVDVTYEIKKLVCKTLNSQTIVDFEYVKKHPEIYGCNIFIIM